MLNEVDVAQTSPPKLPAVEFFVVPIDPGAWLVYAPLKRAAFVANERLVNSLYDWQTGAAGKDVPELEAFLGEVGILDGEAARLPITTPAGNPRPTSVTLFLTTACNLRCTYCYASAGDTPSRSMPLATAVRGIDFVVKNTVEQRLGHFDVAYHGGGEPTVNWDVLTGSYEHARREADRLQLSFSASTATNGVLSDEKLDWILKHLSSASISFDGVPEAHDRNRLTVMGHGSSERVMHTMARMDDARFPYGVRMTITAEAIPSLPDSVAFLCERFRPTRIQVEPAYPLGRWKGKPSSETEQFVAAFRQARAIAAHFGFELTYSAARLDLLTNHFCGVTQDAFALSPDGNVSACYEVFSESSPLAPVFFYGKPDGAGTDYTFNLPVLNHLRSQAVQNREYCQGCFAKWHCAGDCYHRARSEGQVEFAGTDRCHITRELLRDLILERILSSGGVAWRGLDDLQGTLTTSRNLEAMP